MDEEHEQDQLVHDDIDQEEQVYGEEEQQEGEEEGYYVDENGNPIDPAQFEYENGEYVGDESNMQQLQDDQESQYS